MQVRERRSRQIAFVGGKVLFALTREADDQVGPDGGVRQAVDDAVNQPAIRLERIRPAHPFEQWITAMLERQVEVRRETAITGGDECDDVRRAVHRLERADPKGHVCRRGVERAQQIEQRR